MVTVELELVVAVEEEFESADLVDLEALEEGQSSDFFEVGTAGRKVKTWAVLVYSSSPELVGDLR